MTTPLIVQTPATVPFANVYLSTSGALERIADAWPSRIRVFPALTPDVAQDEVWILATQTIELKAAKYVGGSPLKRDRDLQTLLWGRRDAKDHQGNLIQATAARPDGHVLLSWVDAILLYAEMLAIERNTGTPVSAPADSAGLVETKVAPENADLTTRYTTEGKPGHWFYGKDDILTFLSESFPPGTCFP